MNGNIPVLHGEPGLLRGEVPFWPDHYRNIRSLSSFRKDILYRAAQSLSLEAVADQFDVCGASAPLSDRGGDEVFDGDRLSDNRQPRLEALFHRGKSDLPGPLRLENTSLRPLPNYRNYFIHTNFRGFLDEPFEPIVVLGRTYGHSQRVGMASPVGNLLENLC